jgi:hypothetical protein
VQLEDDQEGTVAAPDGFDGTLAPGQTVTFSVKGKAVAGQYHNTAVVTADTPGGEKVTDTDESWYFAQQTAGLVNTGSESLVPLLVLGMLLIGGAAVLIGVRALRRGPGRHAED